LMTSKLQKKPSALKKERPALQNMKFLNFFLLLWVIFDLLDPDPDPLTRLNPDPQPWTQVLMMIKTRTSRLGDLTEFVRKNHPYEVAEVIATSIEGRKTAFYNTLFCYLQTLFLGLISKCLV